MPPADIGAPSPDAGAPSPSPGKDVTPPVVTIASPGPNAQVNSSLTVKVTATDNVGVTTVELYVDSLLMASKSSGPYDFPTVLQAGSRTLKVVARDQAMNVGQAVVSVTVGSTPGPAPPPPKLDSGVAPTPGGDGGGNFFGSVCKQAGDCQSRLCAFDPALNSSYCSQKCGVQDWCPPGSICVSGTGGGKLCALLMNNAPGSQPSSGGCSLGAGSASAGGLGLCLFGLLMLLRYRRRGR